MKKAKLIITLMILAITFFCLSNKVKADTSPKLYIENIEKYSGGQNVTVNIYMENVNDKLMALGFNLEYDTAKLEFISAKAGKDLKASIKLAENIPEENRVAIGAISLNGFSQNGLYYSVNFKILDESEDIPIKLSLREATGKSGEDINIELVGATITKESKQNTEENETTKENQTMENFEETNIDELESIETLIKEKGNIEITSKDNLVYETEENKIAEILPDGTIIPVADGITNIRVKLNEKVIENIEVDIKEGKVSKITATDKNLEFKETSTTQNGIINKVANTENNESSENKNNDENIENEQNLEEKILKNNQENNQEESKNKEKTPKYIGIIIISVVVLILLITFIILKFIIKIPKKSKEIK